MAGLHGFFKIVLQPQLGFLPLPPAAVQIHFPQLHFPNIPYGHRITLWYSEDQHWEVGFSIVNGLLSFTHGWVNVVEGIPILPNYWVTFTPVSDARYDMIVYTPNGTDLRDLHVLLAGPQQNNANEVESDDDSDDDVVEIEGWVSDEDNELANEADENGAVNEAGVAAVDHVEDDAEGVNEADVADVDVEDDAEGVNEPDVADVDVQNEVVDQHVHNVVENQPEFIFDEIIVARKKFRFPARLATLANLHHEMQLELFYEDGDGEPFEVRQEMNMGRPRFNISGWKDFVNDKGIDLGQEIRLRYDPVQNALFITNV